MNQSKTNNIIYEQPLRCFFFLAQLWEYIQELRHWQRGNVVQLLHTRATDWIIQPQLRENGMGNESLIFSFDYWVCLVFIGSKSDHNDCLTPLRVSKYPFNTLKVTIVGCTPNPNFRGCKSKNNVGRSLGYVFLGFFTLFNRFYPPVDKFGTNYFHPFLVPLGHKIALSWGL